MDKRYLSLFLLLFLLMACNLTSRAVPTPSSLPVVNRTELPTRLPVPTRTSLPESTATSTPTPFDKWSLWSKGTQLRGINIYQRRNYPELEGDYNGPGLLGPPYTQQDFDQLAALGCNYVNISHAGIFTEKPPFVLDKGVLESLDKTLAMVVKADMFAVISFRTGPGRSEFTFMWTGSSDWADETYLNDSVWQDAGAQKAWVEMWRAAAEHYRDNPVVVGYDLMVEPNSNDVGADIVHGALNIWDPQEFYQEYGGTLYDWNQMYPAISETIRQVDASTPILIGGESYSSPEWLPYLKLTGDSRTVYTVHQYSPHHFTHQDPGKEGLTYPGYFDTDLSGDSENFNFTWLQNYLAVIGRFKKESGAPVAVNEFGLVRWTTGGAEFLKDEMDIFEQYGANYALWSWDSAFQLNKEVISDDFNFRRGTDPTNHVDVPNPLQDVILEAWKRNVVRPSNSAP